MSAGYSTIPLTFNRLAVAASATVGKEKNSIHALLEVDITEPRKRIREHFDQTGEKWSLTAYVVKCLADTVHENPRFNSFIKGRKLVLLNEVTVSVLIEREITGEKIPEPVGIQGTQEKSFQQINNEIRKAQQIEMEQLGSLSGTTWIRFIPGFLLRTFIRIADKNIYLAKKYGKVSVTAVGMFGKEAVWFLPLGGATTLVTVGGINDKLVMQDGQIQNREHLCLTLSFDHNIIDGAPAARFLQQFKEKVRNGEVLKV